MARVMEPKELTSDIATEQCAKCGLDERLEWREATMYNRPKESRYYVICTSCSHSTPGKKSLDEAIEAWNAYQDRRKATAGDERRDT